MFFTMKQIEHELKNSPDRFVKHLMFSEDNYFFENGINVQQSVEDLKTSHNCEHRFAIVLNKNLENASKDMATFVKFFNGNLWLKLCDVEGNIPKLNHFIYRGLIYDHLGYIHVDNYTVSNIFLVMKPLESCQNLLEFDLKTSRWCEYGSDFKLWFGEKQNTSTQFQLRVMASELYVKKLDFRGLLKIDANFTLDAFRWKLMKENRAVLKQIISNAYMKNKYLQIKGDEFRFSVRDGSIKDVYKQFSHS